MTVIITLTRRQALRPHARLSMEADILSLATAHHELPTECEDFIFADAPEDTEYLLEIEKPACNGRPGTQLLRVLGPDGRWSASHWRVL